MAFVHCLTPVLMQAAGETNPCQVFLVESSPDFVFLKDHTINTHLSGSLIPGTAFQGAVVSSGRRNNAHIQPQKNPTPKELWSGSEWARLAQNAALANALPSMLY